MTGACLLSMAIASPQLPLAKRQGIPHHMLDILDPHDDFSVGHFYDLATKAADDIISVRTQ